MRDALFDMSSAPPSVVHPPNFEPLLTTKGLTFTAGDTHLLADCNLSIRKGSRTILMGPNGAGKSLLLRLMHGLISPTSGAVFWQNKALDRSAQRAQAMVFQRPVMLRRSAAANLDFALSARGIKRRERPNLIQSVLKTAGLSHLAKRPARVLSGGEQQRLAVARALACKPKLLFLDEPTASLDPASTAAIEQLVLEANAEGVTIVMVTHDIGQARRIGEDLVFLQDGRIAETGPIMRVLASPKTEPVRAWRDGRIYLPEHHPAQSD